MKCRNSLVIFFLAIVCCSVNISCLKKTDKIVKCKLTRVKYQTPQGATIDITYNNDGKISTMKFTGISFPDRTYNYFGNTIVVTTGSPGNYVRDTITIDDKGRPLNLRKYSFSPTIYTNYQFEYNGDDLARIIQTRGDNGVSHTATLDYLSGNMISLTYASATTNFEYYTERDRQPGDILDVQTIINFGISIYPHKNLIKAVADQFGITNYSYEFDDDGLIKQVTSTNGANSSFMTYQYDCN